MKVEMTFNDDAIAANGYKKEDIYQIIKSEFTKYDLPCSSDSTLLSFEDTGNENDYANIWNILTSLLISEWFVSCASSCTFVDDDGEEDVLSQAQKVQRHFGISYGTK